MKDVKFVKTIEEVLEIKNAKSISYEDGVFKVYTGDVPNGKYVWAIEAGAHTYDGGYAIAGYVLFETLAGALNDLVSEPYPWDIQVCRARLY